jgi:hypothetical protein
MSVFRNLEIMLVQMLNYLCRIFLILFSLIYLQAIYLFILKSDITLLAGMISS